MTGRVLVAGTGKMGLDVGLRFASRGWAVTWAPRDEARLDDVARTVGRKLRRLAARGVEPHPDCGTSALAGAAGAVDVLFEAVEEDLAAKQELFARVGAAVKPGGLVVSGSSSLLPEEIAPGVVVLHFFYPVELTGLAEAVLPADCPAERRAAALALAAGLGLEAVEQTGRSAFLCNRLLLPIQAECFRALFAGVPASAVDEASSGRFFSVGQLSLMDSIGLDVVAPAVESYVARLPSQAAELYAPLRRGLATLIAAGKRGAKNRDGILRGSPLPLLPGKAAPPAPVPLSRALELLFVNTCLHAVARGLASASAVELMLGRVFGTELSPFAEAAGPRRSELAEALSALFDGTGLHYFRPARAFEGGAVAAPPAEDLI